MFTVDDILFIISYMGSWRIWIPLPLKKLKWCGGELEVVDNPIGSFLAG